MMGRMCFPPQSRTGLVMLGFSFRKEEKMIYIAIAALCVEIVMMCIAILEYKKK